MLEKILINTKLYISLGIGLISLLYYFLIRKTAKLEEKNEILTENIKDISQDAEGIIEAQNEEINIAAAPTPKREHFFKWVRDNAKDGKP